MMKSILAAGLLLAAGGVVILRANVERPASAVRATAVKAMQDGNFKDAYEAGFARLSLDPGDDPLQVSEDLLHGIDCLRDLGRVDEIDDFREKVIAAHAHNWRLLSAAAGSLTQGDFYGFIVAGKFYRGNRHGTDGRQVTAIERDRVRAMQLMTQAAPLAAQDPDTNAAGRFYFEFAERLLYSRAGDGAWRLQSLTDLSKLPDYEEGYRFYNNGNDRGAPVAADGSPAYHHLPQSWETAQTDGERWRWCLEQAGKTSPDARLESRFVLASFLHDQFGVQTMANAGYARFIGRRADVGPIADDPTRKDESGPYAVNTLSEDETIARLASGIKRFKLPDEFNFIHLLQSVADQPKSRWGEESLGLLAEIFENRQQYDRAEDYWKRNIADYGAGPDRWKQLRLDQVVNNWAEFDPLMTQPSAKDPVAYLLFRNGKKIEFKAYEIDVKQVLDDVKEYLSDRPRELDYQEMQIDNLGYRLVEKNQKQYIVKQAAAWTMDLTPREKHFDKRVKVDIPIKAAGAYLITARMEGGNTTRIVLWLADTVIVKKPVDTGAYYFVADASSGAPLPNAKLDFFGYYPESKRDGKVIVNTKTFTRRADADGQCVVQASVTSNNFTWITTATTKQGGFAYLGFSGIWSGRYHDAEYNQQKVYVITDRPVYRPGQTVKFKIWLATAKYDLDGPSEMANQSFVMQARDPRGQKMAERAYKTDDFGGFDGEIALPSDATLGVYALGIEGKGGGNFRVEEYKKPEYEVTVDAPATQITLGEKLAATIKAKYYFGTPVVQARVHYKVMRRSRDANWFPAARWDWFYEPGYWWFVSDYLWYPGWAEWGMRGPVRLWWPRQQQPPELVCEDDSPIGPDGTVKVEIDTAPAKALHGDEDHQYTITAEVTDASRRTIVGSGEVLVARRPFKVYAWLSRGYYQSGDVIEASFAAQSADNKPIANAKGQLKLLQVSYDASGKPNETEVEQWELGTDAEGNARQQIKAAQSGQYRLSYAVTDDKGESIEGGYVFVVRGQNFDGRQFRFNDIELVTDQKEYRTGETVRLMINTARQDSTVLLFQRPSNGIYLPPRVIRLTGKSTVEEIGVVKKDMPNFFIEAMTVSDARVYDELREVVVPPEERVVNVRVSPSSEKCKPGEKTTLRIRLTDGAGAPVTGSAVLSLYDKSVEYVSGGTNVPEIKSFFWKWRRNHYPQAESSVIRPSEPLSRTGEVVMQPLGAFGEMVGDKEGDKGVAFNGDVFSGAVLDSAKFEMAGSGGGMARRAPAAMAAPSPVHGVVAMAGGAAVAGEAQSSNEPVPMAAPTVRKNFADTALWVSKIETGADGTAQVEATMPQSLTTWKARVWSMSNGTRVGQGESQVITYKNLIVRLESPRFFVQKDQVVLSANVHNYLKGAKNVKVALTLDGGTLAPMQSQDSGGGLIQTAEIAADGEKRFDWGVKVVSPGTADIKVAALTDEESDAMEQSFPVYIHGMLKTESFAGALRPAEKNASLTFNIPPERLPGQSRVEIRYSPSVAAAMVDALPYLVDYPYGCTEQTLNRFLPTVITQKVLLAMNLDLKSIREKRTNLNAQEIGDAAARAADWKRNNPPNPGEGERNPVFDEAVVADMAAQGVTRLSNMQVSDGGWGWFSGIDEQSWPHETALVVHGLQVAQAIGVALPAGMLERGQQWLVNYQSLQVQLLKNAPSKTQPYKTASDDIDAFVYMVLADASVHDREMMKFLYRDRNELAVYGKVMFGIALHKQQEKEKLDMILQNIAQYVVEDNENQTAYLKLPNEGYWWCWYGSDVEAMGYYLKLLSKADPQNPVAARLAKYLINNRKNASYWNSTRDTAICIEALADYIHASGEDQPDMTVALSLDGRKMRQTHIGPENLFTFDNTLVLSGEEVTSGAHTVEFTREGVGPLYFNAYVSNFTLEDPIRKAGLEVRVQRKFYRLKEVKETSKVSGDRGQAIDQAVEKYQREEIPDGAVLKSGDLVEIELEIDSKNDYEYVLFEDMKASGFEPVEVQSGYNGNDLNAYMELRDNRVSFFARTLARGKHSVSYRLRAEVPGAFSALPTRASAMYAPELKGNSDELKVTIED